jgi:hypothetical protein
MKEAQRVDVALPPHVGMAIEEILHFVSRHPIPNP